MEVDRTHSEERCDKIEPEMEAQGEKTRGRPRLIGEQISSQIQKRWAGQRWRQFQKTEADGWFFLMARNQDEKGFSYVIY